MAQSHTHYSEAVAARICEELRRGRSLNDVCRDDGMPAKGTVQRWVRENIAGFAARYDEVAHPAGRRTEYDRALADRICEGLWDGRTLRAICEEDGMPAPPTVLKWVKADHDDFAARYRAARDGAYMLMADDILDIADDVSAHQRLRRDGRGGTEVVVDPGAVTHSRLRVKTRCWLLARMLPRTYGSQGKLDADGDDALKRVLREIDGRTRYRYPNGSAAAAPARTCCPHCGGKLD